MSPPAGRALAWLPLAAGLGFAAFLLSLTRPGVFFCGDAGIKFALIEQLARGDLHADLRLAAEPWVADLWQRGHYPFQPPFVYRVGDAYFAKDPLFFLLLAAPAYALLGWPGLYLWPLLGLCAVWLALLRLCRRSGLGSAWTALALLALVFASPLTLYAAMLWEHTLAVALAFSGLVLLAAPARVSPRSAALAGLLLGAAVWLRTEHVFLCLVAAMLLPWAPGLSGRRERLAALAGLGLAAAVLLAWNTAFYGEPLGMQARQIVAEPGLAARLRNYLAITPRLLSLVAWSGTPVLAAALAAAFLLRRADGAARRALIWWGLLALLLVFGLASVLPPIATGGDGGKQLGPRFLLVLYPVASFLLARGAQSLWEPAAARGRCALAAVLAVGLGFGAWQGAAKGARDLAADYAERVAPILELVRSDAGRSVVVADQYAAQELASLLGSKRMFFFADHAALMRLAAALRHEGEARFYLVTFGRSFEGDYPIADAGAPLRLRLRARGCTSQFCLHAASVERARP